MKSKPVAPQETTGNTIAMRKKTATQTRREFLTNSTGIVVAGVVASPAPLWAAENRAGSMLASPNATPRRIILDTDPGADDAMAIFLALLSPELKVEAITGVSGNVPLELTLPNALRLVEIAGGAARTFPWREGQAFRWSAG